MAKREALDNYLTANTEGKVLRYYLNQSEVAERLKTARTLQSNFAEVTQDTLDEPIDLSWKYIGCKEIWLDFTFAEKAANPEYRISKQGEFTEFVLPKIEMTEMTRRLLPIGQHGATLKDFDGTLVQMTHLRFPDTTPESILQVQYKDRNGVARGPFEFSLSPQKIMQEAALKSLGQKDSRPEWVELRASQDSEDRPFPEFDKWYDTTEIWFTGFLMHGWCGVKSIKYGLNVDKPDRSFPVPSKNYESETMSHYVLGPRQSATRRAAGHVH